MHPRWSLSDVFLRLPVPLRLAVPLGLPVPPRLAVPRLALSLRLPVPLRLALLVAAAGLAAAACGPGHATASGGASKPTAILCGTARTPANVPVKVEITKGKVACSAAMSVEHQYRDAILDGKAPGAGAGGPVNVGGWQCRPYSTPVSLKTGYASRCTKTGAEILAVLPNPT